LTGTPSWKAREKATVVNSCEILLPKNMFACREESDSSESYIRHVIENQEMHTGIHEKGLELAHPQEGACLSIIC
jgi:hypothetical protein